jgi:hypothetical protein
MRAWLRKKCRRRLCFCAGFFGMEIVAARRHMEELPGTSGKKVRGDLS